MILTLLSKGRLIDFTPLLNPGAAGMKTTTRGGIIGAGDISTKDDGGPLHSRVRYRNRCKESPCVGVEGVFENFQRAGSLKDAAKVHDRYLITHEPNNR